VSCHACLVTAVAAMVTSWSYVITDRDMSTMSSYVESRQLQWRGISFQVSLTVTRQLCHVVSCVTAVAVTERDWSSVVTAM